MTQFPTLEEITPNTREVAVFYNNEFQYFVTNEGQLNNIRLWAMYNKLTQSVRFVFNGADIFITEKGDLTDWPLWMFDGCSHQLANMVRLKRGESINGPLFFK
jgi:hypothetical protein